MSTFRPSSRRVKLKPGVVRAVPRVGSIAMSGDDLVAGDADPLLGEWWSNGEAAWRADVLDDQSRLLMLDHARDVPTMPLVSSFLPRNPRLKLEFLGSVTAGRQELYAYRGVTAVDVVRFVPAYVRPPKWLFASVVAEEEPLLRSEEDDEVVLGRLKPSSADRNHTLVDAMDPASMQMLVVPVVLGAEELDYVLVTLGLNEAPVTERGQDALAERKRVEERAQNQDPSTRMPKPGEPQVLRVREDQLPVMERVFKQLGKLAEKLGVRPPEMVVGREIALKRYDAEGREVLHVRDVGNEVTVTVPDALKFPGNFDVLAKVEQVAPGKNVVHAFTKDDAKLPKALWSCDMTCDHCGKVRNRLAVFLVEDLESGERKRVGSACLDDFTGHAGMAEFCRLAGAFQEKLVGFGDDDGGFGGGGGAGGGESAFSMSYFLTVVAMLVRTRGWVSRSAASERSEATADVAMQLLSEAGSRMDGEAKKKAEAALAGVTSADEETAGAALAWVRSLVPTSDYEQNISTLGALDYVRGKHAGYVASIVVAYQRVVQRVADQEEREAAAKRARDRADADRAGVGLPPVGPYPDGVKEGDRFKLVAKLVFDTVFETQYGVTHLYKFVDAEDRRYTWKASRAARILVEPSFAERVGWARDRAANLTDVKLGPVAETPAAFRKLVVSKLRDGSLAVPAALTLSGQEAARAYPDRFKVGMGSHWGVTDTTTGAVTGMYDQVPIRSVTRDELVAELGKPPKQQTPELVAWLGKLEDEPWANHVMPWADFKTAVTGPEETMSPLVKQYVMSSPNTGEEKATDIERGRWYELVGTVKRFGEYRGEKQTDITRCDVLRDLGPTQPVGMPSVVPPVAGKPKKVKATVVLTAESQRKLLAAYPPKHGVVQAEQQLVVETESSQELPMGSLVKLRVVGHAINGASQVAVVEPVGAALGAVGLACVTISGSGGPAALAGGFRQVAGSLELEARVVGCSDQDQAAGGLTLNAGGVLNAGRGDGTIVLLPLVGALAKRWPDPVTYNHGHQPHLTVCYVTDEKMDAGDQSTVLNLVRDACRKVAPFRLYLDVGAGLQTFPPKGEVGEEVALWLGARSGPGGALERMHRIIRIALESEGIEVKAHDKFVPHVTWAYVPVADADPDSAAFARWSATVTAAFPDGAVAVDVNTVSISFNGEIEKVVSLNASGELARLPNPAEVPMIAPDRVDQAAGRPASLSQADPTRQQQSGQDAVGPKTSGSVMAYVTARGW